jgi:hypothetical protein
VGDAGSDKYRLIARETPSAPAFAGAGDLPEALKTLIARGSAIFERVRRLDETMYQAAAAANPVSEQIAVLRDVFGR